MKISSFLKIIISIYCIAIAIFEDEVRNHNISVANLKGTTFFLFFIIDFDETRTHLSRQPDFRSRFFLNLEKFLSYSKINEKTPGSHFEILTVSKIV